MSAVQSNAARVVPVRPSVSPHTTTTSKPSLRLVEAPAPEKSAARFIFMCIAILTVAVVAVLILNTEMANGTYERAHLTRELSTEVITGEQLSEQLADVSTAENLSNRAEQLGMEQKVNPKVLHLDSSKINARNAAEGMKN
ncbi:hypothetical protein [Timonella sp. A28]|uniref:hypothetical protein n=1 Tax=Timonella sp. A28 TaxID=3442640 RepID=UPI003EB6FA1D